MTDANTPATDVSELLDEASAGDAQATDRLLPLVYGQLRAMAQHCLNAERRITLYPLPRWCMRRT